VPVPAKDPIVTRIGSLGQLNMSTRKDVSELQHLLTRVGSANLFDAERVKFLAQLSPEDKALLANCQDPGIFLSHLKDLDNQHHGASYSRRAVEFCDPVIVAFRRFGRALDVLCQIKPEILASLWGGLRIVLHVAESFKEFFDSIMSSLETIGNNISRVTKYENLFPDTNGVKTCLRELYSEILQFFLYTKKLYKDALSGKKRIVLPRRLVVSLKAMLSAFHEDTGASERAIQKILDRLDKEAGAASFEYVKAIKDSQTKELQDAKTHRDKIEAEITSQTSERQAQLTERQHQAIERQTQAAGRQSQAAERQEQAEERKEHATERQEQATERKLQATERMDQATERKLQSDWKALEQKYWQDQNIVSQNLVTSFSEEAQKSLIVWLSPVSSEDRHDEALKAHFPGTCTWIFDTHEFVDWTGQGNWMLWVHGIPGAGKTVLTANTIKRLQDDICPDEAIAYFYFDHRNADSQTTRDFLTTIIVSLIGRSPAFLEAISKDLNSARLAGRSPTVNLLRKCLADSIQHFETVFIVVDALDESSMPDRTMEQLIGLRDPARNRVKLLVTSRTNAHIEEILEEHEPDCPRVKFKPSLTHPDIVKYVEGSVNDMVKKRKLKLRDASLQRDIISALSEKSDGMFQWVKCQLSQLRTLKNDKAIRKALETLPKGLNETYVQALHWLVKHHELDEVVQIERLLRWLAHAARPLNINEMAEVIAVDFGQRTFDLSAVVTDPIDLLKYGESLITISGEKSRYLQLSHFSVKEFLESEYCLDKVPRFYMEKVRSNAQIAQVCLTALSFEEHAIDHEDNNDNNTAPPVECPLLYEYSISHWVDHYHVAHSSDTRPEALATSLLVSKPVNRNFVFIRKYLGRRLSYLPIHYCAQYGLVYFLQDILDSGMNIDLESEPYGTPLNFAARHDRAVVNEFLLDRCADVNKVWSDSNQSRGNNCLHWALDGDRVSLVSERLVSRNLSDSLPIQRYPFVLSVLRRMKCPRRLTLPSLQIRYIAETPGVDINLMGGVTSLQRPLHYPARANRPEILNILLSCGAAIDGLDGNGRTPLHIALEERALESVHFLLEQGASMMQAVSEFLIVAATNLH
jgi:ankyrin repeat protein